MQADRRDGVARPGAPACGVAGRSLALCPFVDWLSLLRSETRRLMAVTRFEGEFGMRSLLHAAIAAVLLFVPGAFAEEAAKAPPCSSPEFRQLDFWVGTWDLSWTNPDGTPGTGRNVISRSLNDCVIEENFTTIGGERPFSGMSVSTFDTKAGHWRQTWVDNAGGYLPFTGGPSEEGFQFRLVNAADGRTMRMIWKNVKKVSLDWHWQESKDGGKSWEDRWVIHYRKAK